LAVAGDSGGANALAPVLQHVLAGSRPLVACAYREARSAWNQQGIPWQELPETLGDSGAEALLEHFRPAAVLTGTSMNGVDLERRITAAAARRGVPSLALLDYWTNYRPRFADAAGRLTGLPDRIAVMDEHARRDMVAAGFPADRLVVTGQPVFDELEAFRGGSGAPALRAELDLAPADRLLLFISQPLSELYGDDCDRPNHPGFTEHTVLQALLGALEGIGARHRANLVLLVRPHSKDPAGAFAGARGERVRVVVSAAADRRTAALGADLVIGMNSITLLEACLLGRIVLSVQPGLRLPDPLPSNRTGSSRAVYEAAHLAPTIESLLFDPAARAAQAVRAAQIPIPAGATKRVIRLLDELLARAASPLAGAS
jgi:hypothetical protein